MEASVSQSITLARFQNLPGKVYAPVPITWDRHEYVKIVKADLVRQLKFDGIRRVEIAFDMTGDVLFLGGIEQ